MELRRYILRRTLQMIPIVFMVVVLNFILIHLAPGDPATVLAGDHAPLEYIERLRESYGLNDPLMMQLGVYLGKVVRGELGYSFAYQRPVISLILERLKPTLLLILTSEVLAIIAGTFLGAFASRKYPSWADSAVSVGSLVLYCIPVFWSGLMLILLFAVTLRWLPSSGMYQFGVSLTKAARFWDSLRHLFLPVTALFLYSLPTYVRLTRASILEVAREDFITTARAIGYSENIVFYKHALRNALLPTVTVAGLRLGLLFAGALLTETVFAWPGMGSLMWEAVTKRDYPVLMGVFLFTSICVIIASLMADIIYAYVDPRVAYK